MECLGISPSDIDDGLSAKKSEHRQNFVKADCHTVTTVTLPLIRRTLSNGADNVDLRCSTVFLPLEVVTEGWHRSRMDLVPG